MPVATETLFDKLGGSKAIESVVDEFYKRVLGDEELRGFFAETDMDKQRRHQTNFITMALGGPNKYSGRSMKIAHEDFRITSDHFDRVAGHLADALAWAGVGQEQIGEVLAIVGPLKGDVVTA
ncbi:MAG: group 1 truncated hemoglobin [Planctomycetes bacterium]|nr:group 1 truncated hemoglobin [Planctomycetota bacterium]